MLTFLIIASILLIVAGIIRGFEQDLPIVGGIFVGSGIFLLIMITGRKEPEKSPKTEYILNIISQDSVMIKSNSTEEVYTTTFDKIGDILIQDNL